MSAELFTEVEMLPSVHRAVHVRADMLWDFALARQLCDTVHGRLRQSTRGGGHATLEIRNWESEDGYPLVPVAVGDWIVEIGDAWVAFDPEQFAQVFREHHGLLVVHERSLKP